jgi:hypothetical protein
MSSSAEAGGGRAGPSPYRVVTTGREGARKRGTLIEADEAHRARPRRRAPETAQIL